MPDNMSDSGANQQAPEPPAEPRESESSTAVQTKPAPVRPKSRQLPPWKVLLHNDDVNAIDYVVETVVMLTTLDVKESALRVKEAEARGLSLLLTTHRERAELYQMQFASRNLTVTIEPA